MKTYNAKPGEIAREWYVVDAEGKTLGRLATAIADTLRGKNKPQYTPHVDTGDFVVVVNAEQIHVTGNKLDQKMLLPPLGLPGRAQVADAARAARAAPDRGAAQGGQGNAPAEPARARADQQAEDLRGARAPARGAGAQAAAAGGLMAQTQIAQYRGTGKRKTSVARVILRPGDGATWFNGRTIEEYFPRAVHRQTALAPLKVAELEAATTSACACTAAVRAGQAGAVRHGIARALVEARSGAARAR